MKKIIIILLILISNNLSAQDVLTESFGSENLETLNYSFSKKDLIKINDNKAQITWGSNPRLNNRFGVNINMGSPTFVLSASLDYFITSSVNIEAGAGLLGAFGGMKYHFFGSKNTANWTPYLGLYIARNFTDVEAIIDEIFGLSSSFNAWNTNLYFPVGFQYISKYGFTFGVEFAGRILVPELAAAQIPFGGAIKFGYHFKTY